MSRDCSVSTCENSYSKTKNVCIIDEVHCKLTPITYHSFPKNPILRKKWIKATGRENWCPVEHNSFICSEHFRVSDFAIDHSSTETTGQLIKVRRILKREAFPTQQLGTILSGNNNLSENRGQVQQVSSTREMSDEYQSSENEVKSTTDLIPETQIKTEPEEENASQENLIPLTSSIVVKEECDINDKFDGVLEPDISMTKTEGKNDFHINLKWEDHSDGNLSSEQKYEKLLEKYLSLKRDYDLMKTKYDTQMEAVNECENILKRCKSK